jgi:hypothetical protein
MPDGRWQMAGVGYYVLYLKVPVSQSQRSPRIPESPNPRISVPVSQELCSFAPLVSPNLVHQLDDPHALRSVRVVLPTYRVIPDFHAQAQQGGVDALDLNGVCVCAAGGVGHSVCGGPLDGGGGPVARVDENAITNVGEHCVLGGGGVCVYGVWGWGWGGGMGYG